jgi:hypothetical protein
MHQQGGRLGGEDAPPQVPFRRCGGGGSVTFTLFGVRRRWSAFGGGGGRILGHPWGGEQDVRLNEPSSGEATAILKSRRWTPAALVQLGTAYTLGYIPEDQGNSVNGAVIH